MSLLASRNARAFNAAQRAYDDATPDDDPTGPDCPECGAEMEWVDDEWRCEACREQEDEPCDTTDPIGGGSLGANGGG